MKYTEKDLESFKHRNINTTVVDSQLAHFNTGFDYIHLTEPANIENGIILIPETEEEHLLANYEQACQNSSLMKMVPASGSASRMFKDLFTFMDSYKGSVEEFLQFVQQKESGSMFDFFEHMDELPFYTRLSAAVWNNGKELDKMLAKQEFSEVLKFILGKKGLNYGDVPKGLVDFHIYRDFARTAFDEHIVEGAMYCNTGGTVKLHFTISEEYTTLFKARLKKVAKVFEQMFKVKYEVSFSIQKPSTDTVSIDHRNEILRDDKGEIVFRPGGHGALIYNLNELDADIIFIKNIDNVIPDRSKDDTIKYKKLLAGTLVDIQQQVFDYLNLLDAKPTTEQLAEISSFLNRIGYKEKESISFNTPAEQIEHLRSILDRPIRVCGMVKNEGEPGGGPFWVKTKNGSSRLMIIESAQVNLENEAQKNIFESSSHFNPVDLVCGVKNYKGEAFDLEKFIDTDQGFITSKSYKGNAIKVQELPGLWNGAMANWITLFVEVPLTTFTPVKTVFDLFRIEHRNVLKK